MVNFLKVVLVTCFFVPLVSQTQASELSLDSTDISSISSKGASQGSEAAPSMTVTVDDEGTPGITQTLSTSTLTGSAVIEGEGRHSLDALLPEPNVTKPVTVNIEVTDDFTDPGLAALNFNIAPMPGGGGAAVPGPHFLGVTPDSSFGESGEGIPVAPEPSTMLLLATGVAAAVLAVRLRKRTAA